MQDNQIYGVFKVMFHFKKIPYLFEQKHPVVLLFKNSKDQYIISAIHEEDLDYEPMSTGY